MDLIGSRDIQEKERNIGRYFWRGKRKWGGEEEKKKYFDDETRVE